MAKRGRHPHGRGRQGKRKRQTRPAAGHRHGPGDLLADVRQRLASGEPVDFLAHVSTLLALTLPFVFSMLGLGLYISTRVGTREAAGQMAMGTMMPSIFLSGYVFPLDSMPKFFWYVAQFIPTTWMIDAARGVILRGAGWEELKLHSVVLWGMAVGIFTLSTLRFHKRLS